MADVQENVNGGENATAVKVQVEETVIKRAAGEEEETPQVDGGEGANGEAAMVKVKVEESAPVVKTEATEEPSGQESKIIRQVEYYFGDINLARDKFLQEQIKLDDGWVPMETMLKFNRLKSLSNDAKEICDALRKSKASLLEVTEDNSKLRRSKTKPLPENTTERKAELKKRTIYAKGFPLDSTLDMIEEFFRQYGPIENIQLRRNLKREFKGSVFVIFEKEEDAEKFVKAESVLYQDNELKRSLKDDYFKRKDQERQQEKLKREKERQAHRKEAGDDKEKDEKTEEEEIKEKMTNGALLHLTGFEGDITIDDVRNFFNDFSTVRWVDFEQGDKEAVVRFVEANEAAIVMEKIKMANDGKIRFHNLTLEGDVLEGEAEIDHWRKIFQAQADKMKNMGGNRNQRGRKRGPFGFKKGHQYRSGGREKADGEPPAKAVKTE